MSRLDTELVYSYLQSSITRRSFVLRSVAAGIGASILGACGGDDNDSDTTDDGNDSAAAADEETPSSEEEDGPNEGDEEDEPADTPEEDDDEADDTSDSSDGEQYGGSIRIGLYEEPATLDPHTTTSPPAGLIREHIYEKLVELGQDLAPSPMLADSWEISEDGLSYTFELREEARFHNGEPLTPDDIRFTFERILEISPRSADYAVIDSIEVDGERTAIINLSEFSAPFIATLTQNFAHIAPRGASEEEIEAEGSILTPIGTGPYEFVSYEHGQEAVIRRHEDYVPRDEEPNGKAGAKIAYIDEITFIPMADETVRLLALENGEIDHMQQFPPAEFERVEAEGNLVTSSEPGTDWGALYFNFTRPPFDDLRMRQAVAWGIDWQALANAVFWGHGVANNSFIPHTQQYWRTSYHDELHPHDPERARELVQEYGYDGETLQWWARDNYRDSTTAQTVQQMFSEIGLNFEIQIMESAAFLDGIYVRRQGQEPEWPLVTTTASSFRADPDQHYYQRVHSSSHAGMYSNSDYDALAEEARSTSDDDERRQLYEECQRIVMEDIPVIVIFNAPYLDAYQPRLQGLLSTDPLAPFYWNVWVEE